MKTSELIGPALDWAVAKCEGYSPFFASGYIQLKNWIPSKPFTPSTDWSQGGPIVEQEGICVEFDYHENGEAWSAAYDNETGPWRFGTTPLIAAMRCFCCAKLGDEIDIPEELK